MIHLYVLIQEWLLKTEQFLGDQALWIGSISLLLLIVSLFAAGMALRHAKGMKARWKHAFLFAQKLQPENELEQNLNDLLDLVAQWIDAPIYMFYLYNDVKKVYLLKAVRHSAGQFGRVEPSYSGLVEYKKEQYMPPLSLAEKDVPNYIGQEKVGEIKLFTIPIGERQGLIRVGPMKRVLHKRNRRALQDFAEMMKVSLRHYIQMDDIRNKAQVTVSTGEALKQINSVANDSNVTIDYVLRLAVQVMLADGAFCCIKDEDGYRLTKVTGVETQMSEGLALGETLKEMFAFQLDDEGVRLLTQADDAFYQLPPHAAAIGAEAYAIIDISERRKEQKSRLLVMWFIKQPDRDHWLETKQSLRMLANNLRDILDKQSMLKQFSGIYVQILKSLAALQDNLSPFTVGYSELMSRYSVVIAKKMGLDEQTIKDVALAAYLSNIGVLGINADFVNKKGKVTEEEYEVIKLHAEVGANIVQSTLGNDRVSKYIMHHHERMDGNGYPSGLSGEDIPLGSRIIGVVQTFLAFVNGRKYRDPLPFNQAIQMLTDATGSQLDGEVVRVLVNWFNDKRAHPQISGRSLGVCWEMCCAPSDICQNCPAYQRIDVNCWEVEGNLCKAHGKECKTCFVQTEFATRGEPVA